MEMKSLLWFLMETSTSAPSSSSLPLLLPSIDTETLKTLKILRFGIGVIADVVCLLLYAAPILTFLRVIKKRSTEEFSCIPYVMALLNCVIYAWYGSPVISNGWENLPLVTINSFGSFLELVFIVLYFCYASPKQKRTVAMIMTPVMLFFIAMFVSTITMQDRALRKAMVGSIGCVASIAMYGSPLVAMKLVIQTKSVEYMPFFLSLFSFLASSLWMIYALLGFDVLLASPNFVGVPLGALQLVLYCIYRNNEEKLINDVEKGDDGSSLITPLISEKGYKDDSVSNERSAMNSKIPL